MGILHLKPTGTGERNHLKGIARRSPLRYHPRRYRRSGDIDAVVTETGQRTAERRASCGDGPTHRGIPGDHLVGTPFGGWGPGTMLGLPRPLHPGTFAPRPHPYILLYIVLTGRCRVQRVQTTFLAIN